MGSVLTGYTTNTPDRFMLGAGVLYRNFVSFAALGDSLGATIGGCDWDSGIVYRDREIDGVEGTIQGARVLQEIKPKLTVRLAEWVLGNVERALGGVTTTGAAALIEVGADVIGVGDGANADFTTHVDLVENPTIWVEPVGGGVAVLKTLGTHYTIVLATGVATFTAGNIPILNDRVLAKYKYDSGGAVDHDTIVPRQPVVGDYINNLSLVAPISGKTNPCVITLLKAISDGAWKLSARNNTDGIIECTFDGHYPAATPTVKPFTIWFPRT